jgi:putative flippase GtrA
MRLQANPFNPRITELARFVINGLVATAVHYGVLSFNIRVLGIPSAGLSNFIAAWFGITVSFVGSRFFVFRRKDAPLLPQAMRFLVLYVSIACLHGLLLFVWTDLLHLNYTVGFLVATILQTMLSYLGSKMLVFPTS